MIEFNMPGVMDLRDLIENSRAFQFFRDHFILLIAIRLNNPAEKSDYVSKQKMSSIEFFLKVMISHGRLELLIETSLKAVHSIMSDQNYHTAAIDAAERGSKILARLIWSSYNCITFGQCMLELGMPSDVYKNIQLTIMLLAILPNQIQG